MRFTVRREIVCREVCFFPVLQVFECRKRRRKFFMRGLAFSVVWRE